MDIFLNLAFENTGAGRLIEASAFQDMCGIDPIVRFPAHNMFFQLWAKLVFINRNLGKDIRHKPDPLDRARENLYR